jgi:hypothetical protein
MYVVDSIVIYIKSYPGSRLNSSISCDILIAFAFHFLFACLFFSFAFASFKSCDIYEAASQVGHRTQLERRGSLSSLKVS